LVQATLYRALVELFWGVRRSAPIGEVDRTQLHILALLTRRPGLRSSEVSKAIGLDLSTVSRHCTDLISRNLLERQEDPDDRRAAFLRPTELGHSLIAELADRQQAVLDKALSSWNSQDQEQLLALITRLTEDLTVDDDVVREEIKSR
jgi:DNA-binding MarR family transcriptional regulator